jgi:hypothetical protein
MKRLKKQGTKENPPPDTTTDDLKKQGTKENPMDCE